MDVLNGKTAVITGAGSGIGRALALRLSEENTHLALADIHEEGLTETLNSIKTKTREIQVKPYLLDVADKTKVFQFSDMVLHHFGEIDILINNAGVSSAGRFNELTLSTLEWTININLWGVIYMTKAFLPHLLTRPQANIVNISSVFGLLGVPGQTAYCTSKFAVRGLTEALRQELHQSNLSVTAVFPGGVKTNIAKNSRVDYFADSETIVERIRAFESTLKTSADDAAQLIIKGIKNRSPRVLIGKDAKAIDFLARFKPNSYDKVVAKYVRSQD